MQPQAQVGEGPWAAPSAPWCPHCTAPCDPLPRAQGRSSHVHDNTNLAQATIAVWHTEIENYNSAQQSQFERHTKEIPVTYQSRDSPFWILEKKIIQQITAPTCPNALWGCVYLFNTFGRTSKSTSSFKSCWYPHIQAAEASSGREPGPQQEPGSARASAQQHLSHPSSRAAPMGCCQQHWHWPHPGLPIWQAGHNAMMSGFVWFSKHQDWWKMYPGQGIVDLGLQTKFNWFTLF